MSHSIWKKIILLVLLLLAAGAGFWFGYWTRTPRYAAGEIYDAVTRRDFQLFRERVDLEKVYGAAIDDFADEALHSDTEDHRLAAGLMRALKKPLTDALIRETERAFQEKKDAAPSFLSPLVDRAKASLGTAALTLSDIAEVTEEPDGSALASVRLHDSALGRDFLWKVRLEKDPNGVWTATRVDNLADYLAERQKLAAAKK